MDLPADVGNIISDYLLEGKQSCSLLCLNFVNKFWHKIINERYSIVPILNIDWIYVKSDCPSNHIESWGISVNRASHPFVKCIDVTLTIRAGVISQMISNNYHSCLLWLLEGGSFDAINKVLTSCSIWAEEENVVYYYLSHLPRLRNYHDRYFKLYTSTSMHLLKYFKLPFLRLIAQNNIYQVDREMMFLHLLCHRDWGHNVLIDNVFYCFSGEVYEEQQMSDAKVEFQSLQDLDMWKVKSVESEPKIRLLRHMIELGINITQLHFDACLDLDLHWELTCIHHHLLKKTHNLQDYINSRRKHSYMLIAGIRCKLYLSWCEQTLNSWELCRTIDNFLCEYDNLSLFSLVLKLHCNYGEPKKLDI